MSRTSKDLAKRLRFRHFPNPDTFRRYYWWTALGAVIAAVAAWLLMGRVLGPRQYMPRPVTSVHATFTDRCEDCHDAFQVVQDARCLGCHSVRVHSEHEEHTPACRSCHVEHLEKTRLTQVESALCIDCHAELGSRRPGGPEVAVRIRTFADHPPSLGSFGGQVLQDSAASGGGPQGPTAARPQGHDPTKLRFNHKVHLTSAEISEPLECANCHQTQADGRDMTVAFFERYESRAGEEATQWPPGDLSADSEESDAGESVGPRLIYCRKCHAQNVKELPAPFGDIEAVHAKAEAVHAALIDDVLALGVRRAQTVFEADQVRLPGRAPRMAVDSESKTWSEFQDRWVSAIETELYRPLSAAPAGGSLFENNKYCFLCHENQKGGEDGAGPAIAPPGIPSRWMQRAEFSHRVHEKMECAECHGDLKQSSDTADVNLPPLELCQKCHHEDAERSAGTQCVLCHQYHDTSKDGVERRVARRTVPIDVLTGVEAAKAE